MASARPVIAFAQAGGAREWIDQGRTGFIVENEDEARHCLTRLADDASLRRTEMEWVNRVRWAMAGTAASFTANAQRPGAVSHR